jgi:hypothetical protein
VPAIRAGAGAHGTSIRVEASKALLDEHGERARELRRVVQGLDAIKLEAELRSFSLASTSMSQRISRWSETNPTGRDEDLPDAVGMQALRAPRGCRAQPGLSGRARALERRTTRSRLPRARRPARGLEELVLVGVALGKDALGEAVRREDDVGVGAADPVGEDVEEGPVVVPALDHHELGRSPTASARRSAVAPDRDARVVRCEDEARRSFARLRERLARRPRDARRPVLHADVDGRPSSCSSAARWRS